MSKYAQHSLRDVSADSATDVWAVGSRYTNSPMYSTLVKHWDGTTWRNVPSPSPGRYSSSLESVDALSPTDVWAVGTYEDTQESERTLVEHWDGTAWTQIYSPSPAGESRLTSVSARSARDVWAVGIIWDGAWKSLVEHWDGTSWTVVPGPKRHDAEFATALLFDVHAISANDVWAVGDDLTGSSGRESVTAHWNGRRWSIVTSPTIDGSVLDSVDAVSTDDVWAVGAGSSGSSLAEHWNGTRWRAVASPHRSRMDSLDSVSVVSASDVWAVGYTVGQSGRTQTLTERWDGSQWTIVSSPNHGRKNTSLFGVSAVSANDVWAVGRYEVDQKIKPVIEHWSGSEWEFFQTH